MTDSAPRSPTPALFLAMMLGACAPQKTDYPSLLPTDQILAEPALPAHAVAVRADPAPVEAATSARAEALRARARALSGPVVEDDLRRRADGALEPGAGG